MLTIILGAFGLFRAAMFWVAIIMAIVEFIRVQYGLDLGLDEATVTAARVALPRCWCGWCPMPSRRRPSLSAIRVTSRRDRVCNEQERFDDPR